MLTAAITGMEGMSLQATWTGRRIYITRIAYILMVNLLITGE